MIPEFTRKARGVTNQRFFNEITEGIEDGVIASGVLWGNTSHREAFLDLIDDWMEDFKHDNKIIQYEVRCDKRNNTPTDNSRGIYTITIRYTRWNCLQTTEIEYTIYDPHHSMEESMEVIDF